MEVGLGQLGELLSGIQYTQQWFADWTAGYFNRDLVHPPNDPLTDGTPVVSADKHSIAGDASSSPSSPNLPIDLELNVSTDQVGVTGRTPSVATLPPATTPLVGQSQVRRWPVLWPGRLPPQASGLG